MVVGSPRVQLFFFSSSSQKLSKLSQVEGHNDRKCLIESKTVSFPLFLATVTWRPVTGNSTPIFLSFYLCYTRQLVVRRFFFYHFQWQFSSLVLSLVNKVIVR